MPRKGRALGVSKRGSRAHGDKLRKSLDRAGKRKCTRCKVVWNRTRGDTKRICLVCREHCSRCNTHISEEITGRSPPKNNYRCMACTVEVTQLTQDKERNRDRQLVNKYGITLVEYDAILKAQGGACWICEKIPSEGQRRLSVDHLHSKGEKKRNPREKRDRCRGLLCWPCNAALGSFKDNITKLRRAADYLEAWPAQKILKKEEQNGKT